MNKTVTSKVIVKAVQNMFNCLPYFQGPGTENFFDAPSPAPFLFNKLWLQFQICSGNFTFQVEILIRNIYYKKER